MEKDKLREQQIMQRVQVVFKGGVQGVGFRYTMQNLALKHRLSGWVKNMPDGYTVMAEFQGPEDRIEKMLQNMQNYFSIEHIQKDHVPVLSGENGFSIRF